MESEEWRSGDYAISTKMARSTGTVVLPVPVDVVVGVVDRVSQAMPRLRLMHLSAAGATVDCKMNIWTWGLRITLSFRQLGPDQTQIWAECKPKLVTTLFDYGQGERDLRALLVAIDDEIASAGLGRDR
ncbi:MAG: hypothetical protein QOH84_5452 [Kribbellaceae bacterium]|jgi:hypothetical protein|nr:hypothetical protein [Kribbellaceae bacterium]